MKTLYLDCGMGAAGDMLAAALLELLPDPAAFVETLRGLGLPGVGFTLEKSVKCGITGSHLAVTVAGQEEGEEHPHSHDHHGHSHEHRNLHDIRHLVEDHLQLPEAVRGDILAVYDRIAQAESRVHGVPVEDIHFHEVGTLDAVADITAVCLLIHTLAPEEILASPVRVGSGQVRCAHGLLPVPAPATALLLREAPIYAGDLAGELCTPTGAALLTHFVTKFGPMPVMQVEKIGYGMGKKDFPAANCVRAMLGRREEEGDTVCQLECNLDDMTPEALGFAQERLWEAGALDVYTVPIGMKKSRPGVLLACLCREEDAGKLAEAILRHTTTLGVRRMSLARTLRPRSFRTVQTPWGPVTVKETPGGGKPEYEEAAAIARREGLTLREVQEAAMEQWGAVRIKP